MVNMENKDLSVHIALDHAYCKQASVWLDKSQTYNLMQNIESKDSEQNKEQEVTPNDGTSTLNDFAKRKFNIALIGGQRVSTCLEDIEDSLDELLEEAPRRECTCKVALTQHSGNLLTSEGSNHESEVRAVWIHNNGESGGTNTQSMSSMACQQGLNNDVFQISQSMDIDRELTIDVAEVIVESKAEVKVVQKKSDDSNQNNEGNKDGVFISKVADPRDNYKNIPGSRYQSDCYSFGDVLSRRPRQVEKFQSCCGFCCKSSLTDLLLDEYRYKGIDDAEPGEWTSGRSTVVIHESLAIPLECLTCKTKFAVAEEMTNHFLPSPNIQSIRETGSSLPSGNGVRCYSDSRDIHHYGMLNRLNGNVVAVPDQFKRAETFVQQPEVLEDSQTSASPFQDNQEDKAFQCHKCSKSFVKRTDVTRHMRTHTGERPFICKAPGCGQSFIESSKLRVHERLHHSLLGDIRSQPASIQKDKPRRDLITLLRDCPSCNVPYRTLEQMRLHLRMHMRRENGSRCKHCGKQFERSCDLIRHVMTHTGEKPFKCKFCPGSFMDVTKLKSHERLKHLQQALDDIELTSHGLKGTNGFQYRSPLADDTPTLNALNRATSTTQQNESSKDKEDMRALPTQLPPQKIPTVYFDKFSLASNSSAASFDIAGARTREVPPTCTDLNRMARNVQMGYNVDTRFPGNPHLTSFKPSFGFDICTPLVHSFNGILRNGTTFLLLDGTLLVPQGADYKSLTPFIIGNGNPTKPARRIQDCVFQQLLQERQVLPVVPVLSSELPSRDEVEGKRNLIINTAILFKYQLAPVVHETADGKGTSSTSSGGNRQQLSECNDRPLHSSGATKSHLTTIKGNKIQRRLVFHPYKEVTDSKELSGAIRSLLNDASNTTISSIDNNTESAKSYQAVSRTSAVGKCNPIQNVTDCSTTLIKTNPLSKTFIAPINSSHLKPIGIPNGVKNAGQPSTACSSCSVASVAAFSTEKDRCSRPIKPIPVSLSRRVSGVTGFLKPLTGTLMCSGNSRQILKDTVMRTCLRNGCTVSTMSSAPGRHWMPEVINATPAKHLLATCVRVTPPTACVKRTTPTVGFKPVAKKASAVEGKYVSPESACLVNPQECTERADTCGCHGSAFQDSMEKRPRKDDSGPKRRFCSGWRSEEGHESLLQKDIHDQPRIRETRIQRQEIRREKEEAHEGEKPAKCLRF